MLLQGQISEKNAHKWLKVELTFQNYRHGCMGVGVGGRRWGMEGG